MLLSLVFTLMIGYVFLALDDGKEFIAPCFTAVSLIHLAFYYFIQKRKAKCSNAKLVFYSFCFILQNRM